MSSRRHYITLKFFLPEQEYEANLALKASSLAGFLDTFQEELRQYRKYRKLKKNQAELIDELETFWFDNKPDLGYE